MVKMKNIINIILKEELSRFSSYDEILSVMKNQSVGDVISSHMLYNFTNALHSFELSNNEFIVNFITSYDKFKLTNISINTINIGNNEVSDILVSDYNEIFKSINWYPPIIYDINNKEIIDGYHRTMVLKKNNVSNILAWVQING